MCWSFFVPFSIFLPWCVLFNRCSLSNRRKTGPPNRCKATPLWRGQRVNESSGNLYMRQSWLSPVNCKVNVLLQCLLTLSNWTNMNKPWSLTSPSLSQHSNLPRWHPRTYRLCQCADKTAWPLDWETYLALPTCKSRKRQLLCLKQVQPYGLASCTAETNYSVQMTCSCTKWQPSRVNLFASLVILRDIHLPTCKSWQPKLMCLQQVKATKDQSWNQNPLMI